MGAQTRAKILIVDDERVHRFMLRSLFAEWGWDAEEADDGTTAVAAVEQGPWDVILMDVRMTAMDVSGGGRFRTEENRGVVS